MNNYLKKFENHSQYESFVGGGEMTRPNVSYCVEQNEVHYNPILPPDPFNGYPYIDLGLPSGNMWLPYNMGDDVQQGHCFLLPWGCDANSYAFFTPDMNMIQPAPSMDNYCFADETQSFTKYNDNDGLTTLDFNDDSARKYMNGKWQIPSPNDFEELFENCTCEYLNDFGNLPVNNLYCKLISKNNGNEMILHLPPLISDENGFYEMDAARGFWTNELNDIYNAKIFQFDFDNESQYVDARERWTYAAIRPVCKP